MVTPLSAFCTPTGPAARGYRGVHCHQPDSRYVAPVTYGALESRYDHQHVLSPGSPEGCWELLTLQWDVLVATCSAPHHPPSLVSSALAPCGTVGYGTAMCSQAQHNVAHTPWCGIGRHSVVWHSQIQYDTALAWHSLGTAQPQSHPLPVPRWWLCCHQQARSCPFAGFQWRTPQLRLVSPGRL